MNIINSFWFNQEGPSCGLPTLIFGSHVDDEIYTSDDGINWNTISVTFCPITMSYNENDCFIMGPSFNDATYYGDYLISTATTFDILTGSDNTKRDNMVFSPDLGSGNGRWVNFDGATSTGKYSDDNGQTWSNFSNSFNGDYQNGHLWVDNGIDLFVVGGRVSNSSSASRVYTSPNGITWTSRSLPSGVNSVGGVAYSSSLDKIVLLCLGTSTDKGHALYSSDGINYTTATSVPNHRYYDGIWVDEWGYFIGAGDAMIYSSDGETWTEATFPTVTDYFSCVIYSSDIGKAYAINRGDNGIYESSDGETWTLTTNSVVNNYVFTSIATR